jgi:Uma2 family endonuclease
MTTAATTPITVESFVRDYPDQKYLELVRGEIVEHRPPGFLQGMLAANLGACLWNWCQANNGGYPGVESGFVLERNPDTVRGPDVFYVRRERVTALKQMRAFADFAPDLAVEIVSPGDAGEAIVDKVEQYLSAGTAQVWVVYPDRKSVHVHTPGGTTQRLSNADTLTGGELLPGFSVSLTDLFAGL